MDLKVFCKVLLLQKKSELQEVLRPSELTPDSKCLPSPMEYISIEMDAFSFLVGWLGGGGGWA